MLRTAFVVSTLLALAATSAAAADIPRHGRSDSRLPIHGHSYTPGIRVWTSGDDLHRRGDRVRVYYRTERDAFVMIFRVDTDGRIRLLFPRSPDQENYGYAGSTYTVSGDEPGNAFYVDDDPGVGYIFGVASVDPFDVRDIAYDGQWDLHGVSDGRIHGDPRSSMEELVQLMLPPDYGNFDTHLLPYYVERRYDYPRFICYDCHTRTPYAYWDPYSAWCRSYTLTVFNDPYYYYPSYWYPTWYYGGTRVVYAQPGGSRYVFKGRGNAAAPGIDYRDRRGTSRTVAARSPESRGVRGIDLGGTGSVPAPRTPMRREAPPLEGNGGGERPRERGTVDNDPRRSPSGNTQQQPGNSAPDGSRRRGEAQPGIQIVPRSEAQTDGRTDAQTHGRTDAQTDGRTEARPPRPEPRTDGRTDGRTEARTDGRTDARTEARPAPQTSRQPEAKPEARPATREARPESRPQAQPQARQPSAPQASPPRESRPEPKPQAKPEGRGSDPGLVRRRP